jgi:hypothetical protein
MELTPGYKRTEVGLIPEEWDVFEIGALRPFVTSGSRGWARYYSDRDALFVRITNLLRESIYLDLEDSRLVNLHLGVYPPDGRVRVAVPRTVTNDAVRLAVIGKLRWIRRQQAKFDGQARQSEREMVTGETHYFLGRRYRLRVIPHTGATEIVTNGSTIELRIRPSLDARQPDMSKPLTTETSPASAEWLISFLRS